MEEQKLYCLSFFFFLAKKAIGLGKSRNRINAIFFRTLLNINTGTLSQSKSVTFISS